MRALLAAILRVFCCHSLVPRVEIHLLPVEIHVLTEQNTLARCSSEAFALYVIFAGCGRAPKAFPKRAHKLACSRLVRIM